jgi:hypothetical protein
MVGGKTERDKRESSLVISADSIQKKSCEVSKSDNIKNHGATEVLLAVVNGDSGTIWFKGMGEILIK